MKNQSFLIASIVHEIFTMTVRLTYVFLIEKSQVNIDYFSSTTMGNVNICEHLFNLFAEPKLYHAMSSL